MKSGAGICQYSYACIVVCGADEVSEGPFHQGLGVGVTTSPLLPHLLKTGDIKAVDGKKKLLTEEKQLHLHFREDLRGFLFFCSIFNGKWSNCEACRNEIKAVSVFHQAAFFSTQSRPSRIPGNLKSPTTRLGPFPGNICQSLWRLYVQ